MNTRLDRDGYFCAGYVSSFANVESNEPLCDPVSELPPVSCGPKILPASCKVFSVSRQPYGEVTRVGVSAGMVSDRDQVLVLKYKDKMYAVDQQCPHSSAPLSDGAVFDIEDFGLALSCAITCPKHMWSFDLTTGLADRGNYKLKTWQVQLRGASPEIPISGVTSEPGVSMGQEVPDDQEVWVRRRPRIG